MPDDVSQMDAGRELDALVAERVMGLVPCDGWEPGGFAAGYSFGERTERCTHQGSPMNVTCYPTTPGMEHFLAKYSSDIGAAWLVVEKLMALGWNVEVEGSEPGEQTFIVTVYREAHGERYGNSHYGYDPSSAPLAICRAALLATVQSEGTP